MSHEPDATLKVDSKTLLEIALRTYTRAENGVPMIDIDTRTQKVIINGRDMLKGARRLAMMI